MTDQTTEPDPAPPQDDEADFWRIAASEWPKLRKSMVKSWKKAGFPAARDIAERDGNDVPLNTPPIREGYGSVALGTRGNHGFIDVLFTVPRLEALSLVVAWGHYQDHNCEPSADFLDSFVGSHLMAALGGYFNEHPPTKDEMKHVGGVH